MEEVTKAKIDQILESTDITKEQYIALLELADELDLIPINDEKTVQ